MHQIEILLIYIITINNHKYVLFVFHITKSRMQCQQLDEGSCSTQPPCKCRLHKNKLKVDIRFECLDKIIFLLKANLYV